MANEAQWPPIARFLEELGHRQREEDIDLRTMNAL